jgi:hypothetical protein
MRLAAKLLAGTAASLLLGWSQGALATPLSTLAGTTQSIAGLTFEFTDVDEVGGIDLSQVDLTLVADALGVGFDLMPLSPGALDASNGAMKDLKLEFTVTAEAGVTAVANHLTATAVGAGSSVSVSELIDEAPTVDVGVFVAWFGGLPSNEQSLGETLHTLTITKNLVLIGGEYDATASTERLAQRFRVVPEPTTGLMLLFGLSGIAYYGRSRS